MHLPDLYDCGAVRLERRQGLLESDNGQVPERVSARKQPSVSLILYGVARPTHDGDRVQDFAGSREAAQRKPGVGASR